MNRKTKKTLIVGASAKENRYSNKAMHMLQDHGYSVLLYNPNADIIEGIPVLRHLSEIQDTVDTVTVYVRPNLLKELADEIIHLKPKRIIFNPGTEDKLLMDRFRDESIDVVEACTLVLLRTEQY